MVNAKALGKTIDFCWDELGDILPINDGSCVLGLSLYIVRLRAVKREERAHSTKVCIEFAAICQYSLYTHTVELTT